MSLGDYLKELRQKKNLSLRETAKRANMSSSYLSQLENGHNNNPASEILEKLSDALSVEFLDLFKHTDTFKKITAYDTYIESNSGPPSVDEIKALLRKQLKDKWIKDIDKEGNYIISLKEVLKSEENIQYIYGDYIFTKDDLEKVIKFIETFIIERNE